MVFIKIILNTLHDLVITFKHSCFSLIIMVMKLLTVFPNVRRDHKGALVKDLGICNANTRTHPFSHRTINARNKLSIELRKC